MIPRKEITRKELAKREPEEPSTVHLKGNGTNNVTLWDAHEEHQSKRRHFHLAAGAGWALSDRFDRILPPHRRYLGRSRQTLLAVIGVVFLCILALIIGLAVGLSNKSK